MHRVASLCFVRACAPSASLANATDAPRRPNVVFTLADDLGWTETGAYGCAYYATARIDRLTAQGMGFTRCDACQNCQPTRAAFMTGQYAPRTGVDTWRTTPVGAITAGDWKLMEFFEDGHLEIYRLMDDGGEQQNLAAAMSEKTKELHAKLLAWRTASRAPMPASHTPGERPARSGKKQQAQQDE